MSPEEWKADSFCVDFGTDYVFPFVAAVQQPAIVQGLSVSRGTWSVGESSLHIATKTVEVRIAKYGSHILNPIHWFLHSRIMTPSRWWLFWIMLLFSIADWKLFFWIQLCEQPSTFNQKVRWFSCLFLHLNFYVFKMFLLFSQITEGILLVGQGNCIFCFILWFLELNSMPHICKTWTLPLSYIPGPSQYFNDIRFPILNWMYTFWEIFCK